jgi:hypothetical protein
MDISRASQMIVMEPFFNVHGSEIPKDAFGKVFHIFLVDRFSMCHQIYSSGMVGHEDCGRGYWGIDPNVGAPTVKNQWNSVMVFKRPVVVTVVNRHRAAKAELVVRAACLREFLRYVACQLRSW